MEAQMSTARNSSAEVSAFLDSADGESQTEGDKGKKNGPSAGILAFLTEMYRVSHADGLSQWCTPGHNRGRALETRLANTALLTEPDGFRIVI
jgi:hypothetical protein